MYLLLTRPRALLGYLLASALLGVLLAAGLQLGGTLPWAPALLFALPLSLCFAVLLPSAGHVSRALPLAQRSLGLGLSLFMAAALLVALLWLAAGLLWGSLLTQLGEAWAANLWTMPLMLSVLALGGCLYFCALLLADALSALRLSRQAQQSAEQAQQRAREAELLMLRAQVNPHFLFNCLNSISALTSLDPAGARAMTLALAQYFRQTLSLSGQSQITLAQELAHCRCLLEIEQLRFGDKLTVELEVEAAAAEALLAPMLLQPLVENAVKHGVAQLLEGGRVQIRAGVRASWLWLSVENRCPEAGSSAPSSGFGLDNVRRRLASLYGEQARLLERQTGDRFLVEITLPWRSSRDADGPDR
ncbi:histidine kinase [Paucibacter sp. AS339]|uniref:sensor histidine kinase n=1 Tax=Paucibacter hankyongi TaxID=3133434 RepID=UPI0030B05D83